MPPKRKKKASAAAAPPTEDLGEDGGDFGMYEQKVVVAEDPIHGQLALTAAELAADVSKILTAADPNSCGAKCQFQVRDAPDGRCSLLACLSSSFSLPFSLSLPLPSFLPFSSRVFQS